MPVEEKKNIRYFSLRDGVITQTSGTDQEKGRQFSALWGYLVSIDHVEDEYEGEKFNKYHFKLEDPNHESLDILQVGEAASASRGILASLLMIPRDTIKLVHFRPYQNKPKGSDKAYTNVWVQWADGTGQKWQDVVWNQEIIDKMPPPREIELENGKKIYDTGRRDAYVLKMCAAIKKKKLQQASAEKIDDSTGEVFNGDQAAKDAYQDPAPEKVRQKSTSDVDQFMHDVKPIEDSDLPF